MRVSAEIRWFWKDSVPEELWSWFFEWPCPPGGGLARVDTYLLDQSQDELGIKRRKNNSWLEIKGLVAVLPRPVTAPPFSGRIQLWSKWTTASLSLDKCTTIAITKIRSMRRFEVKGRIIREIALNEQELPVDPAEPYTESGCNVELTHVRVGTETPDWWTFGCEAFGDIESVEQNLRRTLEHLSERRAPAFKADLELSYPAWISSLRI
jgi:hypothetical protein